MVKKAYFDHSLAWAPLNSVYKHAVWTHYPILNPPPPLPFILHIPVSATLTSPSTIYTPVSTPLTPPSATHPKTFLRPSHSGAFPYLHKSNFLFPTSAVLLIKRTVSCLLWAATNLDRKLAQFPFFVHAMFRNFHSGHNKLSNIHIMLSHSFILPTECGFYSVPYCGLPQPPRKLPVPKSID